MEEIIYIIIATTPGRRERVNKLINSIKENTYKKVVICIYENTDGGCVKPTHDAMSGINGIVFVLNDDMVLKPDTIEKLVNEYKKHGNDTLLQPKDTIQEGNIAVSPFCHSDLYKKYVSKEYIHYFNDDEFADVMKAKGKYIIVEDAIVIHEHISRDRGLEDETYINTSKNFEKDFETYKRRKNV